MAKDYYTILGVTKDATTEEIKRAYRKLAHQFHPDKAGSSSESKFKEINEAYQVLSDTQKRSNYDQFGTADAGGFNPGGGWQGAGQGSGSWDFRGDGNPFGGSYGFGGGGLGDIFENIFGQAFAQVQSEINITLTQAILGDKIELQTSNGDKIILNIPQGTQEGTTFRFRGKGQPFKRGRGDLLVTVRIQMPKRLSKEQKELLEKLKNSGL